MVVVSFLTGSQDDCGRRELANCCNGFHNTPPGWLWREQGPGQKLRLVREDAWRRQGKLGPAAALAVAGDIPACSLPGEAVFQDGGAGQKPARAVAGSRRHGRASPGESGPGENWPGKASLRPASFQQIGSFENRCGAPLPRDYIEFLLAGELDAAHARFFDVLTSGSSCDMIQGFFGFDMPKATSNLDYARLMYTGGGPDGLVAIAGNGAGDYICLDLRGGGTTRRSPVALWRIDHFWRTGEWRDQDLSPLADSFTAFVDGLRPTPGRELRSAPASNASVASPLAPGAPLFRRWSA